MSTSKNNLLELLMQIQWLMLRHHYHSHKAFGHLGNPYRGQGRVLNILKERPEITQKELCVLLDMRPQSLGDLLKKLEQKGYIIRTLSETDKRAMNVRLTEKGKNAVIGDESQLDVDEMFNFFTETEQKLLGEYLTRIIDEWGGNEHSFGFGHHDFADFISRHNH
jgi:DNA-binding MarR family transcriptional regulator